MVCWYPTSTTKQKPKKYELPFDAWLCLCTLCCFIKIHCLKDTVLSFSFELFVFQICFMFLEEFSDTWHTWYLLDGFWNILENIKELFEDKSQRSWFIYAKYIYISLVLFSISNRKRSFIFVCLRFILRNKLMYPYSSRCVILTLNYYYSFSISILSLFLFSWLKSSKFCTWPDHLSDVQTLWFPNCHQCNIKHCYGCSLHLNSSGNAF